MWGGRAVAPPRSCGVTASPVDGEGCDPGRPANFSASITSARSRAYPFPLSMAIRAIAASENQINQRINCTLDCAGAWGRCASPLLSSVMFLTPFVNVANGDELKIDAAVDDEPTQDDEEQNRSGERSPIIFRAPWVGPPTVVAARRATLVFKAWVCHIGTRV